MPREGRSRNGPDVYADLAERQRRAPLVEVRGHPSAGVFELAVSLLPAVPHDDADLGNDEQRYHEDLERGQRMSTRPSRRVRKARRAGRREPGRGSGEDEGDDVGDTDDSAHRGLSPQRPHLFPGFL